MQLISSGSSKAPQAVRAGNLIFVGGQMSVDDSGRVVGADVKTQTRNVFESLKRLLAEAGATMADVVKHNIFYHCDGDQQTVTKFLNDVDEVRLPYFSDPGPTTTEFRCGLPLEGAMIQIDAWAVVGGPKERLMPPGHWHWPKKVPWSHGWKCGDWIFTGGQRSLDQNGQTVGLEDIEIQTDHAFRNLDTMLRAGGGDRHSLMRQNTYFRFFGQGRDVTSYWEKMTNVRRRWMSVPSAAGAGLRILGMPNTDELIQVEGIGMLGEDKQRLQPANHWDWSISNSQFTQGWKINGIGFIGGQISADNQAKAVGKNLEEQTRNVFQFVRNVMAEGNLTEKQVAKLYIYYYAPDDWSKIAEANQTIAKVQREFYPDPGPCVTAVRVSGFAFEDLLIEIEALAVCD